MLSTIPAAAPSGALQNISSMMGNVGGNTNSSMSSASIVVDQHDPTKMVAVWQNNDPTMASITNGGEVVAVEAAYSIDSGQSWLPLFSQPTNTAGIPAQPRLLNPATSGPTVPYAYQTSPSVGFDNANNFYILTEYSTGAAAGAAAASGAIVLQKYNFAGSTPQSVDFNANQQDPTLYPGSPSNLKVIYQWYSSSNNDAAVDPTMTVDNNIASVPQQFQTNPDPTKQTAGDPTSGNVYVSWSTIDQPVYQNPLGGNFNPNRILTTVSSDGGNNFGPVTVTDVNSQSSSPFNGQQGAGGGPTNERDFNPAITVSQGRAPSDSGLSGDPGINPGAVTVAWDNAGTNTLMANTLTAGHDLTFGSQQGGGIPQNFNAAFPLSVNIPNTADLTSLNVRVDIIDPTDQYLGLVLIAPGGQQFTLVQAGILTGANVGVQTYTQNNIGDYEVGTIFDDNATRFIGDKSEQAPYFGDYVPDGGSLRQFLQSVGNGVNGKWTLETIGADTSTSASPGFLLDWSLSFGRGMTPDNSVTIPGSAGLVVPISSTGVPTTTAPASAVPIGPNVSITEDNTLGPDSPYKGRIYAAFVGYQNVTVAGVKNPTSNTDIFLTYSDDGGRTWSTPVQVNNDSSQADGTTGSNEQNPNDVFTGRTQFQPAVAVDPATGTLVITWRDARNDPNNTLVATYIATSIDGGNTFSAQTYANPSLTATDAINGNQVVMGPEGDNGTATNAADATYGYGTSMGLAVYDGHVFPLWTGNLNQANNVGGSPVLQSLAALLQPMVIAAGPRIINSTMGPIPYSEAQSDNVTFTVTFDRPINPPDQNPSFTPADVQVFYHDTTFGDPSIPLYVKSVVPVASSGVGAGAKFGYTEFTVTFEPDFQPGTNGQPGASSGIANFTGTYSYLITPDNGAGNPIVAPVDSFIVVPQPQKPVDQGLTGLNLRIPTSGTGGTGTSDDFTTSSLNISSAPNQVITGITVFLSLTHQNAADLRITLVAPDGRSSLVYQGTSNTPLNLNNAPFTVNGLAGGPVDGNYTLVIDDQQANNIGNLTAWSVEVQSTLPVLGPQQGAPMDQNANGIADENPLTMINGYTGSTPGDVYAVPTPQLPPGDQQTFTTAQSILSPPFNQNTLPLIVPGPQIASTQAIGTGGVLSTGASDLITNNTVSQYQVTFDRPIQTSSFTNAAGDQVSIMGPLGSISGPQTFSPTTIDQSVPAQTSAGPGTLSSTVTVNSGGTLNISDLAVSLSLATPADSGFTAVLIAPDGTQIPLFSGLSGQNMVNTTFTDSAENSITQGNAPYTGTFVPAYNGSSSTLSSLAGKSADGTWTLQITNTNTAVTATLDTWSLNITPKITVTPVNPTSVTINGVSETVASTFTIAFPQQQLSGTYTLQLAAGITDEFGDATDTSQSAGLNILRDSSAQAPTTTAQYVAQDTPKTIPSSTQTDLSGNPIPGSVSSSIVVPDSFVIAGDKTASGASVMQVQLNLSYANDPNLTATLYHYSPTGTLLGQVVLFSNLHNGQSTANFTNTVFDDNATTPIESGTAPYFSVYNPQQSLADVFAPTTNGQQGMNVQGTWTLVVQNSNTTGLTGTINGWSLIFQKPTPTTNLGVPGSGPSVSFQISNLGQSSALSSESWSPVGGASSTFETGQVNAIAVDPSDPTGNTVYVGGASGGIWKTTDFLTTAPGGPTWIPLTNFGPNAAINISSIAVFPRNGNPNDSFIIAATGGVTSGQQITDAPGVGFLISQDGGATWNLYDSTVNVSGAYTQTSGSGQLLPINSASRDRAFVGTTAYQLAVDPQLSPSGQIIIYAALSGTNGGIWRSENSGQTWTKLMAGNATSVVLNQDSGIIQNPVTGTTPGDTPAAPTVGNLQIVYAGMEGQGVFMSTNQGESWNLMAGGIGNPLIVDLYNNKDVNPASPPSGLPANPNGAEGRIVLAVPARTSNSLSNQLYEGWLYAAVATPGGGFYGLFETKDFGQNWTNIQLPTGAPINGYNQALPTNSDTTTYGQAASQYAITENTQGNFDLALTVDATNPNITYLGGFGGNGYASDTGLIRIDATRIADAHSLVGNEQSSPGYGLTMPTGFYTTTDITGPSVWEAPPNYNGDPSPYLNFIRNPQAPFVQDSTLYVNNYASFVNSGLYASWTPMDVPITGQFNPPGGNNEISGTGYQILLSEVDPATGLPRLIAGNLTGIYSGLDNNGVFQVKVGTSDTAPSIDRNGNLQLAQDYYVAAQPSSAAAQAAQALFYAGTETIGGQAADPNLLTDGNLTSSPLGPDISSYDPGNINGGSFLTASGTAVDQQGSGTLYQYWSPGQGGYDTNFVLVNGVARTFGLLQASNGDPTPDPQWNIFGLTTGVSVSYASIVVNPVNSLDALISSSTGNVFETTDQGGTWFDIGTPGTFGLPTATTGNHDNTSFALAFGAPDPGSPAGIGNLGNFIYVGTSPVTAGTKGQIFMSQNAGGTWANISLGLDGSPVEQIVTDPRRGSHDAYAVTTTGVFYLPDSVALANNPTTQADGWVNITGNIKDLSYSIFGQTYNPATDPNATPYNLASVFNTIAANWDYAIPNNPSDLTQGYHPVLYVGANSGVYMSTDNGQSWVLYPSTTYGATVAGGDLPHVNVTDLSLSQGNIDPANGMPAMAGPYQVFTFNGTLTAGSDTVTGLTSTVGLTVGDTITGAGIPSGTTITAINSGNFNLTLSANATAGGNESFNAYNPTATPDPNLLLAGTYGEGAFAINLAPMILSGTAQVDPTDTGGTTADGTPVVTTAAPTIDGLSEVSGFGSTTWVTVVDQTKGDSTYGQVIGGFNPANITAAGANNSTDTFGNFAIPLTMPFGTNGLKTIEVYTTDASGSKSLPVTLTFMLQATNLSHPVPTSPPNVTLELTNSSQYATVGGIPITSNTAPLLDGTADVGPNGTTLSVTETWTNAPGGPQTQTFNLPASDVTVNGGSETFSFAFQDFLDSSNNPVSNGQFTVAVTATFVPFTGETSAAAQPATSNAVTFTIDNVTPASVSDLRLNPANDTGIVGDGVTTDRTPAFIGTTTQGYTVELFVQGQPAIESTVMAGATQTDANGQTYNFSIQLPYVLTEGVTSVYVKVVDLAGNVSGQSNNVGVAITSNVADYNGGPVADPALFDRNTATNQLQWIVSTPTGTLPPWYGSNGTAYSPSSSFNGTLTSGSAVVTGIANTANLVTGQDVFGTGVPAGTTILTINSSTSLTLSANATAGGLQSLTATAPINAIPFVGDFSGNGVTDLAYYNTATATWTIFNSSTAATQGPSTFAMGTPNSSIPVVGRFDPNGPTEEAVYTVNSQGQGVWTIASALSGTRTVNFGGSGDIPVPGDYAGLGYDQLAYFDPSSGVFTILEPNSVVTVSIPGFQAGDVPVPGQYDNQTYFQQAVAAHQATPIFGHTEPAVFNPSTGTFTIVGPNGAYNVGGFRSGDIPAPADYLGLGSDQVVAYRPATGQFIEGNAQGHLTTVATLGGQGDIPITAPLSYRLPGYVSSAGNPSNTGGGSVGNTGSGGNTVTTTTTTGGSTTTTTTGSTGNTSIGTTTTGGTTTTTTGSTGSAPTTGTSGQAGQSTGSGITTTHHHHPFRKHRKVVVKKAHPTKHFARKAGAHKAVEHPKAGAHHGKKVIHVLHAEAHHHPGHPAALAAGHGSPRHHAVDLVLGDVQVHLRRSNKHHH